MQWFVCKNQKSTTVSCSFLCSFASSYLDKRVFLEANGASGDLITCWSSRAFACSEVIVRRFSITVHLAHFKSGANFFVTNVYGPATWEGKDDFFLELMQLQECCKGKWVICGDFNSTRRQEEWRGKCWSYRAMTMFNDLINALALIDLPMNKQSYTWSNMQRTPTLARLDRFLVSTDWDQEFPLTEVVALPRITSDHCPILLSTERKCWSRRNNFRFEKAWLNHEDFISKLPDWWKEVPQKKSAVPTFTAKLRHCRRRIKVLCMIEFYSIREEKKRLMAEIQEIDKREEQQDISQDLMEKRVLLKHKLGRVLNDEKTLWSTRAEQQWLREGDGNTKFFHSIANGRRRTNWIDSIEDHGVTYRSEESKKSYFYHEFKELFTPKVTALPSFGEWSGLFKAQHITPSSLQRLTEPFSLDEIKRATFQLGCDKAPGPDGFPMSFYQTFWDTLKEDIWNIFRDLHEGKLSTSPIDYTFICLVPKKEGARWANDFRPISLLNRIQKILSKVLANRLALVLKDLIFPSQSTFLKGRNITDAYAAACELIGWGCKTEVEGVGVKVDFGKAYDRINWSFFFSILEWWGFDEKWCGWTKLCVCFAKVAILVNGEATNWIKTKRAVR